MKKIFISILFLSSIISAQQIRSWQNYTNMQNVNSISYKDEVIWAATSGGVFNFYESDSSYFKLTKSEGLSSHSTTAIAIDSDNRIWVGSSEGYLNVYDPSTDDINTIYSISKTDESNKKINEIQISNDTAFVSTEFGLILFNTKDFSVFDSILKFGNYGTKSPVKNILLGSTIYAVTQAGIAFSKKGFDNLQAPDAWENMSFPVSTSINKLNIFNGSIYAATNNGIYKYENNNWTEAFLIGSSVLDLTVYGSDLYSIAGRYNNTTKELVESFSYKHTLSSELLYSSSSVLLNKFLSNSTAGIYLASTKGIIILNEGTNEFIYPNGPATNSFISMAVDSDQNLWGGTGDDASGIGVMKFDGTKWSLIDKSNTDKFITNSFHQVSSSEKAVYFSNWGKGFSKYQDGKFSTYFDNYGMTGIPVNNSFIVINSIEEDQNGNAWILNFWAADSKPLSVLTPEDEIFSYKFSSPASTRVASVDKMIIDQYGTKWFSGYPNKEAPAEGLFYFNENGTLENLTDDTWGTITTRDGLRSSLVTALAIDQLGELLIGTSLGLDVISDTRTPNLIRSDQYFSMRQQTINCIVVDPINQKWFGTENGVFLTSSDGSSLIANFTKSNSPLPSDNIKSMTIDKKNGTLYVGTEFGVTAISTLFIEPNQNFSELYVYPNPIKISSSSDNNIVIDGLIEDSEIKILDISGDLINEFRSIGGKNTTWDCKNLDGKLVPSGIYIIVAFDSEVNEIGHAKLAVFRN